MMGHGSYVVNCGGSSSAPSILSPLAPPFTVGGGSYVPLVDLNEEPTYGVCLNASFHNWVNPDPPNSRQDCFSIPNTGFEPANFSNVYGYSPSIANVSPLNTPHASAPFDPVFCGPSSMGCVEATGCSSYVLPAVGNDDSLGVPCQFGYDLLTASNVATSNGSGFSAYSQGLEHLALWGGLWEGVADWQRCERVEFDGNLCAKEYYTNQGFYPSEGMSNFEVASRGVDVVDRRKYAESANIGCLDYESFPGKNSKCLPIDFSTSTSASTSLVQVAIPHAPSLNMVNSGNHQLTHRASYESNPKEYDSAPNYSTSMMKHSPAVVIRIPEQDLYSVDAKDNAHNNSSMEKENQSYKTSTGKARYDVNETSFHQEQSRDIWSNKSIPFHALDHLSGAKPGNQVPCVSLDVGNGGPINSVDNYSASKSLEHHNPAVDSPCWKGAPISLLSSCEVSRGVTAQNMKNVEALNGSNLQDLRTLSLNVCDAIKVSPETSDANLVHHHGGILGSCLDPLKGLSVANVLFREETDVTVVSGSQTTEPSYAHLAQILHDIDELNEICTPSSKLVNSFDGKTSQREQHSCEVAKYTSDKDCASGKDLALRLNVNDGYGDCLSHVPFNAVENVIHLPPSAENGLPDLSNSHGGESSPKLHVSMLVNTMHNLSELLLFSVLNGNCELKGEDHATLEDVISNLDTCVLKSIGRMTATQETCFLDQASFPLFGKLSTINKGASQHIHQAPTVDTVNCGSVLEDHHFQLKEHNIVSGKKDALLSNFSASGGASDMVKDDDMTQAIKKVLAQSFHGEEETHPQVHFYKNLWLEAEASLCSINCMSRFNRMKIEMEKHNLQKENVLLPPNNMAVEKLRSDTKDSLIPVIPISHSPIIRASSREDDVMARIQILTNQFCNLNAVNKTSEVKRPSSSKVSPDWKTIQKLAREVLDEAMADKSICNCPVPMTTGHADDVTARCHILKTHASKSSFMKTSSSKFPLDMNESDKLAYEAKDVIKPDIPIHDFFISSQAGDFTTGFHGDSSSSVNTSAVQKSSSFKDSLDLNTVDKPSYEVEGSTKQNLPMQETPQSDDFTTRYHILKSRIDNSSFLSTSSADKLSSSKSPPYLINVDKPENEVKDSAKQYIPIQNFPSTICEDDVEASVMARLQILKRRDDNSSSIYMDKHHWPEFLDIGHMGLRRDWPICGDEVGDRILDPNKEPVLETYGSSSTDTESAANEFHVVVKNDPMMLLRMADGRKEDEADAVWDDESSSDWEHVLEEEL